jgi:O-antigen ligase
MIGAGANGFRAVYPQYRDETYREAFTHTENEYLQILVDGGMIGAALFGILVAVMVFRWKKSRQDQDMSMNIYGSGAIAGIAAAAIHNLVDFPMHTPMYAMTFICMVSAVTSCRSDIITETADIRLKPAHISALCLAACIFSAGIPVAGGKAVTERDQVAHIASASPNEAVKCVVWAPTSWQAWAQLSRCAANTADRNRYLFSVMCLDQAVQYDPNNYLLWQSVGIAKQSMGDTNGADKAFARMRQLRPWASIPQIKMEKY